MSIKQRIILPISIGLLFLSLISCQNINFDKEERRVSELAGHIDDARASDRINAIRSLGALGAKEMKLQDKDDYVGLQVLRERGEAGARKTIPKIIKRLWDEDYQVRGAAVDALIALRAKETVPEFIKLFKRDSTNAARGIACLGDSKIIPELLSLMRNSPDYWRLQMDVSGDVAGALRQLKLKEAVPGLMEIVFDEDCHPSVRGRALYALAGIADKSVIPQLMILTVDKSSNMYYDAVLAISEIDVAQAMPELMYLLCSDYYDRRSKAVGLVIEFARTHHEIIPEIIKMLDDQDSVKRASAVLIVAGLDMTEQLPAIFKLLGSNQFNRDVLVREAAVSAVVKLGGQRMIPDIINLLKDENRNNRLSAVEILHGLKAYDAIAQLISLVKDVDQGVSLRAIQTLIDFRAKEAVPAFISKLRNADLEFCRSLLDFFCALNVQDALPEIRALLGKTEPGIRGLAIRAIVRLQAIECAPELIKLLSDLEWSVKNEAVKAVRVLGIKEAIPELIKLLSDESWYAPGEAALALAQFEVFDAIPKIRELLRNDTYSTRIAAVVALIELGAIERIPQRNIDEFCEPNYFSDEHYAGKAHKSLAIVQEVTRLKNELGIGYRISYIKPFIVAGSMMQANFDKTNQEVIRKCSTAMCQSFCIKEPDYLPIIILFDDSEAYATYCREAGINNPIDQSYTTSKGTLAVNISTGYGTLVREMIRILIKADFSNAPMWLMEGLALLYEPYRLNSDGSLTGLINNQYGDLMKAEQNDRITPLNKLLAMGEHTFYGADNKICDIQARYFCLYLQDLGVLTSFYKKFKDNFNEDKTGIKFITELLNRPISKIDMEWYAWLKRLPDIKKLE